MKLIQAFSKVLTQDIAGTGTSSNTLYSLPLTYSDDNSGLQATRVTGVDCALSLDDKNSSGAIGGVQWGRIKVNFGQPGITSTSDLDGSAMVYYHKAWNTSTGVSLDFEGGVKLITDGGLFVDDISLSLYRGVTLDFNIRCENSYAATLKALVRYERVLLTEKEALALLL
jgi:hypothetical protein